MQELRSSVRGTLHRPQCYLEGDLETFGGSCRNRERSGSGEHVSDEFDGLTHHIGEPRSKTRMFKRLNGSSQRCQVFRCHACQVQSPTTLINASLRQCVQPLPQFAGCSVRRSRTVVCFMTAELSHRLSVYHQHIWS